jgi:hypothetical protein
MEAMTRSLGPIIPARCSQHGVDVLETRPVGGCREIWGVDDRDSKYQAWVGHLETLVSMYSFVQYCFLERLSSTLGSPTGAPPRERDCAQSQQRVFGANHLGRRRCLAAVDNWSTVQ